MRMVMMGTGTFAEATFETLLRERRGDVVGLVTQPDREMGRRTGSSRQTGRGMATIAREAGVPVIQPSSINSPEGLAGLAGFRPDLLVVAAYGQILKPAVIAAGRMGAINVHASLLPKYRGAAPVAHAIMAGETHTGVTIIRITPGLDAGEMLAREPLAIDPDETAGELESRLAPLGARLCLETVNRMAAGPVTGVPQDPSLVTRAPKLTKDTGHIDWTRPAAAIRNHLRAMRPFPTASTWLHREGKPPQRLAILAGTVRDNPLSLPPGTRLPDRPFAVATGDGAIDVTALQPAGKSAMTALAFANGCPPRPGDRLGGESIAGESIAGESPGGRS